MGQLMVVHTRTLQMTDDMVGVRYSHLTDPTKRLVFASTLMDSTIKALFNNMLKFFLSLYGHKLPAWAVHLSDNDTILAYLVRTRPSRFRASTLAILIAHSMAMGLGHDLHFKSTTSLH